MSRTRPPREATALAEILSARARADGLGGSKDDGGSPGTGDVYLHSGGQYEWDSAAPVAVALAAGAHASRLDGSPLLYGGRDAWLPDLLICRSGRTSRRSWTHSNASGRRGQMVPMRGASDVVVRTGTIADAPTAARLHTEQLDEGMLSSLGPRFLGYLYRRLTLTPGCFLLIAERDGDAVGFIAATENTGAFYKQFLLRDGFVAAVTSAPRSSGCCLGQLETLRHGVSRATASTPAELLSAGVDRSIRGRGDRACALLYGARGARLERRTAGSAWSWRKTTGSAVGLYKSIGFWVEEEFEMHPGGCRS